MKTRFAPLSPPLLLLFAAVAFLVPFLLFLPSVRFPLVELDDSAYIAANPVVHPPISAQNAARAFAFRSPAPMYVPVLWLSYILDAALFGNRPWAFHLSNILLHALDSLLLFLLLLRLARRFCPLPSPPACRFPPGANRFPSLLVARHPSLVALLLALLWSLHPLRVESVAWVAERKDCLAVLFCLLAVHAWWTALSPTGSPRRRGAFVALCFVAFSLGLLSKPSLVPLPLILLALALPPLSPECPFGRSAALFLVLPFFAASFLVSLATARLHALANVISPPPFLDRLSTVPSVFFFYLSKTVFPRRLSVFYPAWTSPLWEGLLLALPCLGIAALAFFRRRAHPLPWLGALWFVLFFLPVSGLVPVPFNMVADRFSCLPAIGFSMALLPFFSAPGRFRRPLLAAAVLACAAASAAVLPNWRSDAALYSPARRLLPDHPVIRRFDALNARHRGDFAASRQCIARARQAQFYSEGNLDYSLLLLDIPNINALEGPEAALRQLRDIPPPPNALAKWAELATAAQLALGQDEDALSTALWALPSALPGTPSQTALLQAAMIASHRLGRPADALRFANLASVVPPGVSAVAPHHFINYYLSLWDNDDRAPALGYFRQIVRDFPDPGVFNNISWILASAFHSPAPPAEAVGLARRALAALPPASPLRPSVLDTLSVALANASDFPAAIDAVSAAIALLPPSSPALPGMQRRLGLYRQSLPSREILRQPVPVSEYACNPHL
ncbi:MAG: tetratricopeptide repeat protein [Kiritimatiellae bacterium]|nr:tetratricopeptide repeat protein [Kiritimatiellia bacterium]